MQNKSALAWLILAVALAVPGVMFRQWWRQLSSPREQVRRPPAGGVFGPTKVAPANPLVVASSPAPSPSAVEAPAVAATPEPALRFAPKVDRDPMLSMADMAKLAALALPPPTPVPAPAPKPKPRRAPRPIESLVRLSGILESPSSITAIVNERVVRSGQSFEVRSQGRSVTVKILEIAPTAVTFEAGKKRFRKAFD